MTSLDESKRNQEVGTTLGPLATPLWWASRWIVLPVHALCTGGWLKKDGERMVSSAVQAGKTHARKTLSRFPRTLEDAEKVLSDHGAEVLYNDDPVIDMWYLTWEHGFMGQGYRRQDKDKAFVRAATFVILWSAGFEVSYSDHLASHWAAKETNVGT